VIFFAFISSLSFKVILRAQPRQVNLQIFNNLRFKAI